MWVKSYKNFDITLSLELPNCPKGYNWIVFVLSLHRLPISLKRIRWHFLSIWKYQTSRSCELIGRTNRPQLTNSREQNDWIDRANKHSADEENAISTQDHPHIDRVLINSAC